MLLEIAIVLVLTLFNGLLAMSELAIVSAREARLKVMVDQGSKGAATALKLAGDPGRFLSSVQIGITLVGILSGAFSGATLGVRLTAALIEAGMSARMAQTVAVGGVVVAITYISLILGELVPKQIALRRPEPVAARVAPLIAAIATIAAPVVWLLDRSGRLVLSLLGQSGGDDRPVSDEEVRMIIAEAQVAGVMEQAETQMIAGVMRIADRNARGLMAPRHEVDLAQADDSFTDVQRRFRETGRARLPVRDGSDDEIIGVLSWRDFLEVPEGRADSGIRDMIIEAPVVRDGMAALDVIEHLRNTPAHMVLVYDEYGNFEGIVTPMDVLEAITGEFLDDDDEDPKLVTREDGSMLVAGWMPADEFADLTGINLRPDPDFASVAGMVIDVAGNLPAIGAHIEIQGWRIEVVDLDGRRIDKLLVQKLPSPAEE